jgi:hypothetical protein
VTLAQIGRKNWLCEKIVTISNPILLRENFWQATKFQSGLRTTIYFTRLSAFVRQTWGQILAVHSDMMLRSAQGWSFLTSEIGRLHQYPISTFNSW